MRIFDEFNSAQPAIPCPLCMTTRNEKTVLVPIDGTEDGNICQALQVHLACLLEHIRINTNPDGKATILYATLPSGPVSIDPQSYV